ncbi:MAG: hypothetical protein ACRDRJ_10805, partial [Streptosporangiaceae bacterium]
WRTLKEIAVAGARADRRITAAANTARRHAWAQIAIDGRGEIRERRAEDADESLDRPLHGLAVEAPATS